MAKRISVTSRAARWLRRRIAAARITRGGPWARNEEPAQWPEDDGTISSGQHRVEAVQFSEGDALSGQHELQALLPPEWRDALSD